MVMCKIRASYIIATVLFIAVASALSIVTLKGDNMTELPEDRITVCRFRDDWFALAMVRAPEVGADPKIYADFGFVEGGRSFSYRGGLSKYANHHENVLRITVTREWIEIEIDRSVSKSPPYLFDRLPEGCRESFIAYVRSSPWLQGKLEIRDG